jgi:hypothetical protein
MAEQQNDPFRGAAERLLARKEAEMDRAKQALEATQRGLKNLYKDLLNDQEVKQAVSQEMIAGVRGETRVSDVLNKLLNKTGNAMNNERGVQSGSIEQFNNFNNDPTGNEDRYWERD